MQIFLLIVIFILIVINLKQADELRAIEIKTLDNSQCRGARPHLPSREQVFCEKNSLNSREGDLPLEAIVQILAIFQNVF